MADVSKIKRALNAAGYGSEPTEVNLIDCYLDYADAYGGDIEDVREEIKDGSLTVNMMCNALIRCN